MEQYWEALSWWRLPLSGLGDELLVTLASFFGVAIVFGVVSFIINRL